MSLYSIRGGFIVLFFLFVVVLGSNAAQQQNNLQARSRWALFTIRSPTANVETASSSAIKLVKSETRPFEPSTCHEVRPSSVHVASQVLLEVSSTSTHRSCFMTVSDPRQTHNDHHMHHHSAEDKSKEDMHLTVRFPIWADRVMVTLPSMKLIDGKTVAEVRITLPLVEEENKKAEAHQPPTPHNRRPNSAAAGQVDELITVTIPTTQLEVSVMQSVALPSETMNIVFVSAGYYGNDHRGYYERDVRYLMNFLNGTHTDTTVNSAPFSSYFQTMNVWRVWHSSDVAGTAKGNNMGCFFGDHDPESLACNPSKVHLAASHAPPDPARTLVIVLVKETRTGGSGVKNIAVVSSEQTNLFSSLMHQIGHAWTSLSNEYTITTLREPQTVSMKNCHYMSYNTPWQAYTDARVVPESKLGCTFPNYYGPVEGECVMGSLTKQAMCPVCQYFTLAALYDNGMKLAAPMYPLANERVYTQPNVPVALFINAYLPYAKRADGRWAFETLWTLGEAQTQIGWQQHRLDFSHATPGDYIINVTMTDHSVILLDSQRQYYHNRGGNGPTTTMQKVSFRVTVSAGTPCVQQNTPYGTTYCGACDPGTTCNYNFVATPLTSATYDVATLAGLENWMIAIGVVFVVVGILIFVISWRVMTVHQEHNPSEILPLTENILRVRMVLIVVQVCVLIMATFCIIYCVYQYNLLTIFGQAIVLGVIACAVVVWFGSYLGIIAAFYKSRGLLFVNFILLLLLFGCVLLFSVLLLYVQTNVESDGVVEQLQSEWETAVKDRPADVCRYQSHEQCSGFSYACSSIMRQQNTRGSTYCPAGCDANQYTDPCILRIQDFVRENFGLASIGGWILTALLLGALVLSVLLGCAIKNRRNTVHRERRIRHATGQNILLPEEIDMLRKEFNKIDKDGSGDISREEFSLFYNAVMGTDLSPRELEEYFDKLDADGNGNLSFEEFLKVYVPHREPRRKSMVKPKSVALQESSSSEEEEPMEEKKPQPKGPPPPKDRQNVYAMKGESPPPRSGHLGDVSMSGGAALQPRGAGGRTPQSMTPRGNQPSTQLNRSQQSQQQPNRSLNTSSQPQHSLNTSTQPKYSPQAQQRGGYNGNLNNSNMSARSGNGVQPSVGGSSNGFNWGGGGGGGSAFEDGLDLDVDLDDDFA